jgi:hypothetical protein
MLVSRVSGLSKRVNCQFVARINQLVASTSSYSTSTTTKMKEEEEVDAPVKYSLSAASHWKAKTARQGYMAPRLWYEPYVILASVTVFLVYFTILREENDVDEELKKSLYSRIDGLEEHQLKISLEYNRTHNLDTSAIIARLNELESKKS